MEALWNATGGKLTKAEVAFVLKALGFSSESMFGLGEFEAAALMCDKIGRLNHDKTKAAIAALNLDKESIEEKMARAENMFFLAAPDSQGDVEVDKLDTQLRCGRVASSDVNEVLTSLAQCGKGDHVTFADFLAHLPWFMSVPPHP